MMKLKFFNFQLVLFVCLSFSIDAQTKIPDNLMGPAFSKPGIIFPMPDKWIKKTIKYEPKLSQADLVVTLDQQLYPAFLPTIQAFAKGRNKNIKVIKGTCGISEWYIMRKAIDIGGYCCPPGKIDRLPGLKYHTLGIGAIALIVNKKNTINNLTIKEARSIFTGDIYNWADLKSHIFSKQQALDIRPIGRLHCKTRPGHWRLLLKDEELFSIRMIEVGTIPDMISLVAKYPESIGYETLWMLHRYRSEGQVKWLKINGMSPRNSKNLISGKYPLYRTFNISTWEGKGLEKSLANDLVKEMLQKSNDIGKKFAIIPASSLKKAGWKFNENELIGAP